MDLYKNITILYVEDDESIREGYKRALSRYCDELLVAVNGEEGLKLFESKNPDIIVSDINMPKLNGLEMAKKIKTINPKQPIIFTTAYSDSQYTVEALDMQVDGYLLKPVDKDKLKQRILQIAKSIYLERENKKQKLIIDTVLKDSHSMIILTDFTSLSFASRSFFQMLGIETMQDFYKNYDSFLDIFVQHDDYLYAQNKDEFLTKYYDAQEEDKIVSIIDGHFKAKAYTLHIDELSAEEKTQYLFNLSDISQIQAQKKVYEHKAYFDELTKIANRAKFEEIYEMEFQRFKRYGNTFSIAILDIDHFKDFNDEYGHLIGDEMLKALAKTINSNTRDIDTFARWGGEEFVLLMPQTKLEEAKEVCDSLRKKVKSIKHDVAGGITISFGVSQINNDDTMKTFFKRCDSALYKAKENGRNRVESA